jgi:hypothetical protein
VTCCHPTTQQQHVLHTSRLTPFFGSSQAVPGLLLLDNDLYIVSSISSHRGTWTSLKTMEFLVQWQGYDSTHDSWEPWSNLRNNTALISYLRDNGLSSKIPPCHR